MHVVVNPRHYRRQRKITLLLQQKEIGAPDIWRWQRFRGRWGWGNCVDHPTVIRALHSRGIKAYVEECKFILNEDNKKRRMVSAIGYYCDS